LIEEECDSERYVEGEKAPNNPKKPPPRGGPSLSERKKGSGRLKSLIEHLGGKREDLPSIKGEKLFPT